MKWPEALKPEIRWSDTTPSRTRSSPPITDLGLAFDVRMAEMVGSSDIGIAALYRGMTFLANRVASFPMQQVIGRRVTQELPNLLRSPNPAEPYRATIAKMMWSILLRGNAYIWIRTRETRTSSVDSIYILNPDEVSVVGDALNLYPEYWWQNRKMIPGREIVHIPFNYIPGRWTGMGPIEAFRLGLDGIRAEQTMARDLMVNNGQPGGILKIQKPDLTDTEAEAALKRWEMADQRTGRRGGPRVMGPVTEYTPLSFKPLDLQFLEQRKFSVQEVARILGLDPFFLGEQSGGSMTYSTTESLLRLALATTIEPDFLSPIEAAFSSMLPSGREAKFNVDEILRADMAARYSAGEIGVKNGMITVNEWRESEGLSPVPGGDELRSPALSPPMSSDQEPIKEGANNG